MVPVALTVHGKNVDGDVAIEVGPATVARERDHALDLALAGPLADIAKELDAILAAAPHRYARPIPGKDAEGLTHFAVRARLEGDRLVPDLDRHLRAQRLDARPVVERRPRKKAARPRRGPQRRGTTAKKK